MSQNELQRVAAKMRKRASYLLNLSNEQLRADGAALNGWASRIESAQAVAPGGWKLVPVWATREMEAAGAKFAQPSGASLNCVAMSVYAAMLAAAPASEAKGQECAICPDDMLHKGPCDYTPAASSVDDVMQSFDDTWADDASSEVAERVCMECGTSYPDGKACPTNHDAEQEQVGEDYLRKFEADNARFVEALPRKLTGQADELPDRIWIPAAVVASYSRKPLPGDSPRVEFVRRAARVEDRLSNDELARAIEFASATLHSTGTADGRYQPIREQLTALLAEQRKRATANLEPGNE